MAVPLLGQDKPVPEIHKAKCAFVVFVNEDGQANLTTDLNMPITAERAPHPHEITGALYTVLSDIAGQQGAAHTVNGMMQMGSAMAQMQQNQSLMKDLKLP